MVLEKRCVSESTAPGSVFPPLELGSGLVPLLACGRCVRCVTQPPTSLLSSLFLAGRQAVLPSPQPPHASHQVSTCLAPSFTPPPTPTHTPTPPITASPGAQMHIYEGFTFDLVTPPPLNTKQRLTAPNIS